MKCYIVKKGKALPVFANFYPAFLINEDRKQAFKIIILQCHLPAPFDPFGIILGSVGYLAFLQSFQTNYGPTQPHVLWVLGLFKWLDHETNHPSLVLRLNVVPYPLSPIYSDTSANEDNSFRNHIRQPKRDFTQVSIEIV